MEKRKVKDLRIGSKVWLVHDTIISQKEIVLLNRTEINMGSYRSHPDLKYNDISEKSNFLLKSGFPAFAFCNLEDAVKELRVNFQKKINSNNERIKELLDENLKYVEHLNSY